MVRCIALFLASLLGASYAFEENMYCSSKYDCHFDNVTYVNTLCAVRAWILYNVVKTEKERGGSFAVMKTDGPAEILSTLKKTYLLNGHNGLRSATAAGKTVGLPSAAYMMKITWDLELERLAFAWALEAFGGHDRCRSLPPKFPHVGQNIALFGPTADRILNSSSEDTLALWQNEIAALTEKGTSTIGSYRSTPDVQNVSQILWAATTKMGCSEVAFNRPKDSLEGENQTNWYRFLVCNYGPGSMPGKPIYLKGKPCSKCPTGYSCGTDPKYPDLCANKEADFLQLSSEAGSLHTNGLREVIFAMIVFKAADFRFITKYEPV